MYSSPVVITRRMIKGRRMYNGQDISAYRETRNIYTILSRKCGENRPFGRRQYECEDHIRMG